MTLPVDVIIPVYNQFDVVSDCLASVVAGRSNRDSQVIVIDDASPDERIGELLAGYADRDGCTVLTNAENLGFTKSVNRGMALHPDRDVLLLNSDTLVYGDWLDRLAAAAYASPTIGTANPLTNSNGSHISGYPRPGDQMTLEVDDRTLDRFAARLNAGRRVRTHVTVGFCMFIKRACIDDIGLFDSINFPVGYGEESDFCYRAVTRGWSHVVAGDVFVSHLEGRSFGEKKRRLMEDMLARFERLHPQIVERDRLFGQLDPIRPLRRTLDIARLGNVLDRDRTLTVKDKAASVGDDPCLVYDDIRHCFAVSPGRLDLPNIGEFSMPGDVVAFNQFLRLLEVRRLRVESPSLRRTIAGRMQGEPYEVQIGVPLTAELIQ